MSEEKKLAELGDGEPSPPPDSKIRQALMTHWLSQIECNHYEKSDSAICACGWKSERGFNVGKAVEKWIDHVFEQAAELGDGEPSSAKEFMETIVAGIKDRVHRACHFCGEIRPDPQPTDYSSVCNSPKNDMLPDTAGNKHHAYQRWPNKNSIMEVRASAEWKQFGCEPKPGIEGVAEWRWRYYATHPTGVDDETYECLMLQAYAAQFTGTNFLEFRSGAAQEDSPPSPEPAKKLANELLMVLGCPVSNIYGEFTLGKFTTIERVAEILSNSQTWRELGDTRELKAALLRGRDLINCIADIEDEDFTQPGLERMREWAAEVERLLSPD